ncbi:MAG: hypothetical protein GY917_31255, partial [Planctomycetaceae bacterium]|nr:hypothetical protein [Planctomycetaceae bacterium]
WYENRINSPTTIATLGPGTSNLHAVSPSGIAVNTENRFTTSLLTPPNRGNVQVNLDGTFTYQPEDNFIGDDQFTYQISDSVSLTDHANVALTVTGTESPTLLSQGFHRVSLHAGQLAIDQDFASQAQPGSLSGIVYEDRDHDGVKVENEQPLADRTVYLDMDADSKADANEPKVVTGDDGSYRFDDLAPMNSYRIGQVLPNQWTTSQPGEERDGFWTVQLDAGRHLDQLDFGSYESSAIGSSNKGKISGRLFHDDNENRIQDDGETGIVGAPVFIDIDRDGTWDNSVENTE